jgi:nitroreductase
VHPPEARVNAIRALFDLPETIVPLNVIALGHPAEDKGRVDRYKESRIHQNTW